MTSVKHEPGGAVVGSPAPQSPTPAGRRRRRPLAIGLGLIGWPLLGFFVLAATFFLLGLALPPAILRSLPSAQALVYTGVLVTIAAVLCWLVARFVASRRTVVRVVAVLVVIMLVPATVWAIAYPDESTYLARTAAWGESDVLDYQKFPARDVPISAQAFNYPRQLTPELFGGIPYRSGGRPISTDCSPPVTPRRSWSSRTTPSVTRATSTDTLGTRLLPRSRQRSRSPRP